MVVILILLCFAAFLTAGTEGKTFRSPCTTSYLFRCDNGNCIHKHNWCDGSRQCNDGSDEKYCQRPGYNSTPCTDLHFKCRSGMCIPIQGYCDGYSSCPDQSDEENCPCEELNEEQENFQYEAYIDQYRTQQKCWKISVNKAQYLSLHVSATFTNRNCKFGNVSIYPEEDENTIDNSYPRQFLSSDSHNDVEILCPSESSIFSHNKTFNYYKDVSIRYRSNFYSSSASSYKDFLNFTFQKIDLMCKRPDAFRCSTNSCISPEKECDGNKDCADGKDEINCDYGALSASYLDRSRVKATKWMRKQHNADWAWKDNTQRAVVALYLAGDGNFNGTSKDDDLIAKQLELEVFTYLFRHKFDKGSPTVLASYINALLVTCHDPHNFYGHNLLASMKDFDIDPVFAPPFIFLTLCNAKERLSEDEISNLVKNLDTISQNQGFALELQALTTMTLSCLKNNGVQNLEQNITHAINDLKSLQMEDGSFGNEYTTALVLQALIANNQENSKDWNPKASIQFLTKRQEDDGSFGDFLTTYLIMPVLNAKSLVDIGKVNCTGNKRPRDSDVASDIQSRLGKKIFMQYSLFIGDEKDQIHPLLLRTPENITVLELMTLAADIDPKYKFKIHEIKKKKFIYEISNIPNDPENNRFWFIYYGLSNDTIPIPEQSPDKIKALEKDHIIMWYKTLDSSN